MSLRDVRIKNEPVKLQMTSMIDVVFLLLAFFVVTFKTPEVEGDFNIKMPADVQSSQMPEPDDMTPVTVRLTSDEAGNLTGILFGSKPLGTDFKQLRAAVFEYLNVDPATGAGAEAGADMEIELDCDGALHYGSTVAAITAVTGYVNSENQVVKLVENVKFTPPK